MDTLKLPIEVSITADDLAHIVLIMRAEPGVDSVEDALLWALRKVQPSKKSAFGVLDDSEMSVLLRPDLAPKDILERMRGEILDRFSEIQKSESAAEDSKGGHNAGFGTNKDSW